MLSRVLSPFREFGAMGILYLADRAMSSISPRLRVIVYDLMVQPIPSGSGLPLLGKSQITVRAIGRDDMALDRMPLSRDTIQSRFDQGASCLGAFLREQLIAYMWFCESRYDEDEVRCRYRLTPSEQSVFDYDFYIFPEHRMSRAFLALWSGANQTLHQRGILYTFSRVTRFNLASRKAHSHLGARRIGKVVVVRVARAELLMATVSPYFRLSFVGRPELDLRADMPLGG